MNTIEPLPDGPPDPRRWEDPRMRDALAARDFARVFRLLQRVGYSQQRIGALTGQSQPEISAVIHGRRVMALEVIERIVAGLVIPPGYLGLVCCPCQHTTPAPADASPAPTRRRPHTMTRTRPGVRTPRHGTHDA